MNNLTPCYVIYVDEDGRPRFWPNMGMLAATTSWWIASVVAAVIAERGVVVTVVEVDR